MSFTRFFLKPNPLKITCTKCGTTLKAGNLIRGLFIGAAIYGFVLGLTMPYLFFNYNWEITYVVFLFIIAVAAVGIPAEYSAWKYGSYKMH
jgi:hypothetical protein